MGSHHSTVKPHSLPSLKPDSPQAKIESLRRSYTEMRRKTPKLQENERVAVTSHSYQDINISKAAKMRFKASLKSILPVSTETPPSKTYYKANISEINHENKGKSEFVTPTKVLFQRQNGQKRGISRKMQFESEDIGEVLYKNSEEAKIKPMGVSSHSVYHLARQKKQEKSMDVKTERFNSGVVSLLKEAVAVNYPVQSRANDREIVNLVSKSPSTYRPVEGREGGFTAAAYQTLYHIKRQEKTLQLEDKHDYKESFRVWKGRKGVIFD